MIMMMMMVAVARKGRFREEMEGRQGGDNVVWKRGEGKKRDDCHNFLRRFWKKIGRPDRERSLASVILVDRWLLQSKQSHTIEG